MIRANVKAAALTSPMMRINHKNDQAAKDCGAAEAAIERTVVPSEQHRRDARRDPHEPMLHRDHKAPAAECPNAQ